MSKRIAIVGAGVAGLALAILAAKQGHQVDIFERRSQAGSDLGAGVTLWPNAIFVLTRMGLLDTIQKASGEPTSMTRYDLTTGVQGELSIRGLNQSAGFNTLTILRRDLMAILFAGADQAGVQIHFGEAINLDKLSELENQYDWVIGADGRMNSTLRRKISPASQPVYQGFVNVIGISHSSPTRPFNRQSIQDYWGDGERFGIVPIDASTCFWAAGWVEPENQQNTMFTLSELGERFREWPSEVINVLQQAEQSSLHTVYVHDLDPMASWSQGKCIAIGDAAHAALPTSGQGACQALEDAWWLAKLMQEEATTDRLFARFQQQRLEKTASIQMTGRHIAQAIFHTPANQRPAQGHLTEASLDALAAFWMSGLV
ncbi:monooxygenase [Marinomonas sp. CT5]|uniref:FAD-dependent oxidoreductase n=1 Tax=Marinomonas sp. CT5 TaxID=2066133 RepID=UPI00182E463E|nr:FAD-dependent oxidoreductase [Marinomonas sp. CT5]NVK74084.1 FAD-dependent monooxygenase [Oceanospirillaceae bacterium]QUX94110.1 monooxygenase [Marinomonas sp. CT5]